MVQTRWYGINSNIYYKTWISCAKFWFSFILNVLTRVHATCEVSLWYWSHFHCLDLLLLSLFDLFNQLVEPFLAILTPLWDLLGCLWGGLLSLVFISSCFVAHQGFGLVHIIFPCLLAIALVRSSSKSCFGYICLTLDISIVGHLSVGHLTMLVYLCSLVSLIDVYTRFYDIIINR